MRAWLSVPQIQAARLETDLINVLTNWICFCQPENILRRLHIFDSKITINLVAAWEWGGGGGRVCVRMHAGEDEKENLLN